MLTVRDRLTGLYSVAGLDVTDDINRAEIAAYSKGIDMIRDNLAILQCSALNKFIYPDGDAIDSALESLTYTASGNTITISSYDISTVGKLVSAWFYLYSNINLGSDGKTWAEWDAQEYSWMNLSDMELRWEMIESR